MVQFGHFPAGTDAEKGARKGHQVIGEILRPAERVRRHHLVQTDLFSRFNQGINLFLMIFCRIEGFAPSDGVAQAVAAGDMLRQRADLFLQTGHAAVGVGAEREHHISITGRGAEGLLPQAHRNQRRLPETLPVQFWRSVQRQHLTDDFRHRQPGVEPLFRKGGMGLPSMQMQHHPHRSGGKGPPTENQLPQRIARKVMQTVNC